jgi:ferredoxin
MGRMITQFALSFFFWTYNTTVSLMKYFHIYLFSKDTVPLNLSVLLVNIGLFILILMMSLRYGRLYCNSLCPVGTLLGLISRVSLFKFVIDRSGCRECVRCEAVRKAGCIDTQNAMIDQSRCVSYINCLATCPQSIVSYRSSVKKPESASWSSAHRSILIWSVATAGSAGSILLMFNVGIRNFLRTVKAYASLPINPPGSVSLAHFTKSCSACHLCVSACPTRLITPSFSDYGVGGLLQQKMNYHHSFCDYECNICGQ